MDTPLVSVGTCTYNHERYVREAIESVLSQTYRRVELVIGDDHSSDSTVELVSEYAARYPDRIRLLASHRRLGAPRNANRIISACRGKYFAVLDGDDLMLPTKIEKQVSYMESHPECTVCYHNVQAFDSDSGRVIGLTNGKSNCHEGDVSVSIRYGTFNAACATMYRACAIPKRGFETRLQVACDWLFWVEVLAHGGEIHYIDEVLSRWRRHRGGITVSHPWRCYWDHALACCLIAQRYPRHRRLVFLRLIDGVANAFARVLGMRTSVWEWEMEGPAHAG